MKISNYNFYYTLKDCDETLLYNSRTNALALIENDNLKLLNGKESEQLQIENDQLREGLLRGGFAVTADVNELDLIKLNLLKSRFGGAHLGLTIAPTLDCNFNCTYCYEKERLKNSYMPRNIKEALLKFVAERIEHVKHFSVVWYGGEPLLSLDIIEDLSSSFIKLCTNNKVAYSASIVTNGYQLTPDIVQRLQDINVSMAQITLDGVAEIHDLRRPLASGKGTFATIVKNIKNCAEMIDITVRVNTDKSNIDNIDELLNILEKHDLKDKILIYLGFVDSINDCYLENRCLSKKQTSKLNYLTEKKIAERRFGNSSSKYPKLYGNFCGADHSNSYVVDPDGFLYKCWNDIGLKECAVGNVLKNTTLKNSSLFCNYLLHMPTDDPECKSCKLLPICMGGCPHLRVNNRKEQCSQHKYNLESYIRDYAKSLNAKAAQ